jgi:UPF0755 protein
MISPDVEPPSGEDPGADEGFLPIGPSRASTRTQRRAAARAAHRRRLRALVLLVALGAVALLVATNAVEVPLLSGNGVAVGKPVRVTIPPGASTREIGRTLEDAGVVDRAARFTDAAVERGVAAQLKPGEYLLTTGMDSDRLFETLTAGPEATADRITFPEGLTVRQIAERMVRGGRWSRREVDAALKSPALGSPYRPRGKPLEGLLFPSTYTLRPREKPVELLRGMLDQLEGVMSRQDLSGARRRNLTPYEILIVASMIEREARVDVDRPRIARVIYNRLARSMRLEIDATVQYALGGTRPRLTNRDLAVDSPHNTYRSAGLPPTPIAAPGEAAIRAALAPDDGPWLYYVLASKDGHHAFTDDADEFLRLKEKARAAGLL